MNKKDIKISIIGLGYVGLPLARLLATKYSVVGFDINEKRINELQNGFDATLEVSEKLLKEVILPSSNGEIGLFNSSNIEDLEKCNFHIITVPTPVDNHNRPVLTPLIKASESISRVLKKGDIVVYESTVYPGVTEDECVPVLEKGSGLKFNEDFFVGYSPERINPGDKEHTVEKILKVTSGSTIEAAKVIDNLYKSVITAGTYSASSIKVAEASKVIENSQRDINIAFVNELSKIFNLMEIDTHEVLKAAGTKWNFLPFQPGLVGGHCIGVDPYYLAQKAEELGYHPEIILAGRRMNDGMGDYVAKEFVKLMIKKGLNIKDAEVLVLGITFKENCPDVRNTKVIDVIKSLKDYGMNINIYDPWVSPAVVMSEYGLVVSTEIPNKQFDGIVHAVAHNEFKNTDFTKLKKANCILFDVKGTLEVKVEGKL